MRKLAVLVGTPTRSKREVVTQDFYFTFLFIELVLLTAISSGIANIIPTIVRNPTHIPSILATNLPKSANYFFNYLVIQSLGFSGSVLFQYLRILYITTIWPWFTQTPRQEAWLQTTIPHQVSSQPQQCLGTLPLTSSRCGATCTHSPQISQSLVRSPHRYTSISSKAFSVSKKFRHCSTDKKLQASSTVSFPR